MRALSLVTLVFAAVSCTPAPGPPRERKPHPSFEIESGTHALGRAVESGELKCISCHPLSNSTFFEFECTGCHEHAEEAIAPLHASVQGFEYASAACYACHSAGPRAPSFLSVGGFTIGQPPAADATTIQAGLDNLPHPGVTGACTSCHAQAAGGRGAHGYDHALAPETGCSACHEAGSDLVATHWTLDAPGAVQVPADCERGSGTVADRGGDTRPVGIVNLACSSGAASQPCGSQSCALNHFYPTDCGECHGKPAAVPATAQTGAAYASNWRFQHHFGAPARPATCCHCHGGSGCP